MIQGLRKILVIFNIYINLKHQVLETKGSERAVKPLNILCLGILISKTASNYKTWRE